MDEEQRKQVLKAELDDAVRQRDDLDTYIAVLAKRLGVEVPGRSAGGEAENGQSATIAGDPVAGVREGQFYGMSGPKASKALLRLVGRDRPLKTQEIFDAIRKGGVTQIQNANTLYRSLTRDPELHNVGRGRWGLTEWYPNARRKAGAAPDDGAGPESQSTAEQDSAGEQQVSSVDQEQMPTG
jgi:hypothetical protein